MMNNTKTIEIKREWGDTVKITANIYAAFDGVKYGVSVTLRPKGKRKDVGVLAGLSDDYRYRALPPLEREKARSLELLKYVTAEEIHQAQIELWESIKPVKP